MTESMQHTNCPACGEPVKSTWRICPACETRLSAPVCPVCKAEVKDHWRRCPECEALLICTKCGKRIPPGETGCPACASCSKEDADPGMVFTDPVCGIAFVRINGGAFVMGDTLTQGMETELPVHEVVLDDFYLSRFSVTQAQWRVIIENNPSNFQNSENPVENVTWFDACDFAQKLSAAMNKNVKFSLPTEAQWEYAARSGGKDELYAGGSDIDAFAWHEANSKGRSHAVGQKKPNGLGLYDMSGNVWEWCLDTYQEDGYSRHENKNPVIISAGPDRVIRGGSWNLDAWSARCARRFNFPSDFFGPGLGFRLVMTLK